MYKNNLHRIKLVLVLFICLHQFQYDALSGNGSASCNQDGIPNNDAMGIVVIDNFLAKLISKEDLQVLETILNKYPTTFVTKDTMSIEDAAGPPSGMIYLRKYDHDSFALQYVVNSDCSVIYYHNDETISAWLDNRELGKFRVMNIAESDRILLASIFWGKDGIVFQNDYLDNFLHAVINKYSNASDLYVRELNEAKIILVAGRSNFKVIQHKDIAYLSSLIRKYPISNVNFRKHELSRERFVYQFSRRNALILFIHLDKDLYYPCAAINPLTRNILWTVKFSESEKHHGSNSNNYEATIGISHDDTSKIMSILKLSPTISEIFTTDRAYP